MLRRARGLTSILLIVLLAIEATPSAARIAAAAPTDGCVIAASINSVTLVTLPSERPVSSADPSGNERVPLAPFAFVAAGSIVANLTDPSEARRSPSLCREQTGWIQARQRRARAPAEPDPF